MDVAADGGWLRTTVNIMNIMQMVMQGLWNFDSHLLTLPNFNSDIVALFKTKVSLQNFGS